MTPFNTTPYNTPFTGWNIPGATPWSGCGAFPQTGSFYNGYNGVPFNSNFGLNTMGLPINNWSGGFPSPSINTIPGFNQGFTGLPFNTGFNTPFSSTQFNTFPFANTPFSNFPTNNMPFNTTPFGGFPFNTTGFNTPTWNTTPFTGINTPWSGPQNTFGSPFTMPYTNTTTPFGLGSFSPWSIPGTNPLNFGTPWLGSIPFPGTPFGVVPAWNWNTPNWGSTTTTQTGKHSSSHENGTYSAPVQTHGVPFGFPVIGPFTPCIPVGADLIGSSRNAA